MKFEKRHIVIALLIIYVFTLTFSTIGFVHASETDYKYVLTDTQATLTGSNKYYLYLDNDTPLTPRYIRDNPDYKVYISCTGNFGANVDVAVGNSFGSCGVWRGTDSNTLYEFSYSNVQTMDYYVNKYSDYLDSPIYITTGVNNPIFTINSNVKYNDETEPTEPEETTPVVPPEDDGEDTAGLLDGLLDGIKSFFTELSKPITDLIESWQKLQESETTIWDALGLLYDYVKGYTFEPIFEFFESIVGNDALYIIVQIWNFPVIKELLIAVVAILVVSGFIRLITTL